jgi:hypothetical protein
VRRLFARGAGVPADVLERAVLPRGARVLASAHAEDGTWLLGTRDLLAVVPPDEPDRSVARVETIPWERVATADWNKDEDRLRVTEVAEYGIVPPTHVLEVREPGLLLQLVRERVTASIVLQRRVPVSGRRGVTVIARRPPQGSGETTWAVELDPGLAPEDPVVREAAARGLRDAQAELGFL